MGVRVPNKDAVRARNETSKGKAHVFQDVREARSSDDARAASPAKSQLTAYEASDMTTVGTNQRALFESPYEELGPHEFSRKQEEKGQSLLLRVARR